MVLADKQGLDEWMAWGRRGRLELNQRVRPLFHSRSLDFHSKGDEKPMKGFKQGMTWLSEPSRVFLLLEGEEIEGS